jgi:N-hydroxyarylamine O-acetyltransferase
VDATAYLARIGFDGPVTLNVPMLEALQRAHMTAVPFENLDVFHRRGVEVGVEWSWPKIVQRRRGGWCFELNGAFAALLGELGFRTNLLAAAVLLDPPSDIPDHLALEVDLDRPYLVDVGFGDSFIRPIPLDEPGPHDGGTGEFELAFDGPTTTLLAVAGDGTLQPQYRFDRTPTTLDFFRDRSNYLQTHPGLEWTEHPFATRLLDGGPDRVTLVWNRLKVRRDGEWTETPVTPGEWPAVLKEWFDLEP